MDCLTGSIGISASCNTELTPRFGYVEDFEGISLKSLSAVEGGKYLSAQNLIDEKLRIVGSKLKEKLSYLLHDVIIEQSVHTIIPIGFSEDSLTDAAGNPGLRIGKKPTRLTKLYIPRFYFKSATEVNGLIVTISDGNQSVTFHVSAEANEEVAIEADFSTNNLEVTITYPAGDPSQTIEPYTGNISPWHRYGCSGCAWHGNHYLKMVAIDFDGEDSSSWYGIRADVEMICDVEKMICLIAPKNQWLIKYMHIVEIVQEWVASDRVNFLAMNGKDWAREKIVEWNNEAEKLWDTNGKAIVKMLQSSEKDCFLCTGTHVKWTTG